MDKLIVTITYDSTMSYPSNPNNPTPRGIDAVAAEYVRSVHAGASICHLHGPYSVDAKIQEDGTKLSISIFRDGGSFGTGSTSKCDAVIQ